jgi:DNA-binding Lrp family transcriptional regulator
MRAYLVVTAESGRARDIARAVSGLPGVKMADACWGVGDIYAVTEFASWPDLNALVLDKIQKMPGVMRTDTHVAVEG